VIPGWADQYLNVSYETADCWVLIRIIYRAEFDIDIGPADQQPSKMRDKDWVEVTGTGYKVGDIALFKADRHVGVILTADKMLHSTLEGGTSCIERFDTRLWKNRLVGVYRHIDRC